MKKQTAGRDRLGDLAPKFAELNDDGSSILLRKSPEKIRGLNGANPLMMNNMESWYRRHFV